MMDEVEQVAAGIGRLAAFWRTARWQARGADGLHPTQAEVLVRVADRPARLGALARELGVTAATLSDSVSTLVDKGLAARAPDPADGRAQQIRATADGRATAAALGPAPEALMAQIAAMPAAERGAMLRALTRIIRGLQEAGAIPVQRMCVTCRYFRPDAHDDAARPHHCALVDAAFGDAALRLDCGEHEDAPAPDRAKAWEVFAGAQ